MTMVESPSRPVLRYFGGKWMLAPWIIQHFPPHRIYVEPFGGAASVLMRKEPAYAEIYNDLDGEIVNVFQVLRDKDKSAELCRQLRLTPYSRDEFNGSYLVTDDPIERARRTLIRAYMGFGSNGHNSDERTGFRAACTRQHTTASDDWANYPAQIARFHERLKAVVVENRNAMEVLAQQDTPETLFFVDPPYVHATRSVTKGYRFEMNDQEHEELCDALKSVKGMVILCGYPNPIYDRLGWETVKRHAYADGAANGQTNRTEVLWLNPACVEAQSQMRMF